MTTVSCASCQTDILEHDAILSSRGPVCDACNLDDELEASSHKGWLSFENIITAICLGGTFSCNLTIGGVDYSAVVFGGVALLFGVFLLVKAMKNTIEPAWLRFGRPALLLLLAAVNLTGAFF